jgi:cyanophycin synthetase
MRQVVFLGKALDCYVAENAKKRFRSIFFGLPRPQDARGDALDWMDDKQIFKEYFREHKLPVADGGSAVSLRGACKIFQKIQKPVIVKPRAGSRGRHSTTFVYTLDDLKPAFKSAKQLCYWAVVEEQLFGPVYRATLINFELCGVLRGDPPQVTGDGTSSIRSLVEEKNTAEHAGVKDILLDVSTERFLERQGLSAESVLSKGQKVVLTEKIGVNYGGSSSEDFEICHPENKKLFVKAAKSLGDPIVGFDFIIPDISQPWQEQKCGFIEANSLPFINLHHDPLLGQPRNVAAKVWEMILTSK